MKNSPCSKDWGLGQEDLSSTREFGGALIRDTRVVVGSWAGFKELTAEGKRIKRRG